MPEDLMPEDLRSEPEDSDAILLAFAYARADAPGDKTLLREWAARYPAMTEELVTVDYARLAAGMTLTDTLDDGAEDPQITALGADIIAARRQARESKPPLTSLLGEAAARGLDGPQLAGVLRLDRLIVSRLERRTMDAATLPLALVRQIGTVLGRSAGEVADFLRGGPRLPASAHFLSRRAPAMPKRSAPAPAPLSSQPPSGGSPALPPSFTEALQSSRNLSAEDKAYWQAEAEAGVLGK